MNITTTTTTVATIALLDEAMPAKVTRPSEAKRVDAKMTRTTITREPDIFDEVEGEAIWFGKDMMLVVPLERLDNFRRYIACRGLAPCGRDTYRVIALTKDAQDTWAGLYEMATGKRVA